MKKLILLLLAFKSYSQQDTVFLNNGDTITGKLKFVDTKAVYFKSLPYNSLVTLIKNKGTNSENNDWYIDFKLVERIKEEH